MLQKVEQFTQIHRPIKWKSQDFNTDFWSYCPNLTDKLKQTKCHYARHMNTVPNCNIYFKSTLNVYIEIEDVKKSENMKQKSKKLIKRKKEYRRFNFNKQIEKING